MRHVAPANAIRPSYIAGFGAHVGQRYFVCGRENRPSSGGNLADDVRASSAALTHGFERIRRCCGKGGSDSKSIRHIMIFAHDGGRCRSRTFRRFRRDLTRLPTELSDDFGEAPVGPKNVLEAQPDADMCRGRVVRTRVQTACNSIYFLGIER